jgi:hypothetical protein
MKKIRLTWFVLCTLWQGAAFAQATPQATPTDAQRAEASGRFRRGVELFQEEAYRAALVEFERAYEVAPDFRLLFNIAQTKVQLQEYLGAAQSYEAYLVQGAESLPPERRAQVEEALKALRERVGRISVQVNRDDVDVFIDDQKVGRAPITQALTVNVGRHRVAARGADGANDAQVIDLAGGDIVEVRLNLAAPSAATPSATAPAPSAAPDEPLSGMKKGAIGTWAGGGAVLIGGLVAGLLTMSSSDKLDKLLATREVDQKSAEDRRDTTHTLALTTDVLIGVGAALVVTGTLLWVLDKPADKQTAKSAPLRDVRVGVGAGSLAIHGRF